jgi:hypothetical protein
MNNRSWVENMIWSVIVLNFVVLMFVFLMPRLQFMASHWGMESETLMETSGVRDIPNQYIKTYRVANQVRNLIRNDSIVLMPPDNEEFDLNRSALIQRLYPKEIYFSGDKGFNEVVLSLAKQEKEIYVMFDENWGKGFCKEKSVETLGTQGFGVCRGSPTELINSL